MLKAQFMHGPPPVWLCLSLPVFLLVCAVIVFQGSLVETSSDVTSEVVQKISDTLYQTTTQAPVPATIIREGNHDEYLAICLYVKNQAQDLPEFFQHHYYEMGIRRFYVMDDGSDPPMSTYMGKFGVPEEAVDFIHIEMMSSVPQGTQL